ncbi:hypothetical protein BV25DRAFT_1897023 [Artomyces pyxidatus]|uniref:Uncharacterized protein n=1 Tax=Artomyces pyxidatus TaxID=48021 RepID=A0ACB8TG40_9AGAM|nr:hypothetical protein BV25DRAFT_1897023 [Artomyces pyxidatus]
MCSCQLMISILSIRFVSSKTPAGVVWGRKNDSTHHTVSDLDVVSCEADVSQLCRCCRLPVFSSKQGAFDNMFIVELLWVRVLAAASLVGGIPARHCVPSTICLRILRIRMHAYLRQAIAVSYRQVRSVSVSSTGILSHTCHTSTRCIINSTTSLNRFLVLQKHQSHTRRPPQLRCGGSCRCRKLSLGQINVLW